MGLKNPVYSRVRHSFRAVVSNEEDDEEEGEVLLAVVVSVSVSTFETLLMRKLCAGLTRKAFPPPVSNRSAMGSCMIDEFRFVAFRWV